MPRFRLCLNFKFETELCRGAADPRFNSRPYR